MVLGFLAGTAAFWIYGLAVNPQAFWTDCVRTHIIDRIVHHNPLNYQGYPSIAALWRELWQHTGYVVLPLGIAALAVLCFAREKLGNECHWLRRYWGATGGARAFPSECKDALAEPVAPKLALAEPVAPNALAPPVAPVAGWRGVAGLWTIWCLFNAAAMSVIDWRQTKHLMPLLLPLSMAPARWAATSRIALAVVGVVLAALLAWNVDVLCSLADNFDALVMTPAW